MLSKYISVLWKRVERPHVSARCVDSLLTKGSGSRTPVCLQNPTEGSRKHRLQAPPPDSLIQHVWRGPENLYCWGFPRWCPCCWYLDYTLKMLDFPRGRRSWTSLGGFRAFSWIWGSISLNWCCVRVLVAEWQSGAANNFSIGRLSWIHRVIK